MKERWYRDGLAFECTQCGKCCTGAPGHVWVSEAEQRALARSLRISEREFEHRYLRRVGRRMSLIEKENLDCIFWDTDRGCTVYESRPTQCRTFPFWPESLRSPASWDGVEAECPGVGRGRLYQLEEIEKLRRGEGETGAAS